MGAILINMIKKTISSEKAIFKSIALFFNIKEQQSENNHQLTLPKVYELLEIDELHNENSKFSNDNKIIKLNTKARYIPQILIVTNKREKEKNIMMEINEARKRRNEEAIIGKTDHYLTKTYKKKFYL